MRTNVSYEAVMKQFEAGTIDYSESSGNGVRKKKKARPSKQIRLDLSMI